MRDPVRAPAPPAAPPTPSVAWRGRPGETGAADTGAGQLARRLDEVRARFPACDVAAVTDVVRAVLGSMTGHLTGAEMSLLAEVQELGEMLARARAEIAAMRVDDITASHIPAASDELDAILTHTAAATHCILEVCESLDGLADGLERPARGGPSRAAAAAALRQATMRVYEACGFQDLTGQRIARVVLTLQAIDARVARILQAPGGRSAIAATLEAALATDPSEAGPVDGSDSGGAARDALLHGPQMPAAAMDQRDIDQLLAAL